MLRTGLLAMSEWKETFHASRCSCEGDRKIMMWRAGRCSLMLRFQPSSSIQNPAIVTSVSFVEISISRYSTERFSVSTLNLHIQHNNSPPFLLLRANNHYGSFCSTDTPNIICGPFSFRMCLGLRILLLFRIQPQNHTPRTSAHRTSNCRTVWHPIVHRFVAYVRDQPKTCPCPESSSVLIGSHPFSSPL